MKNSDEATKARSDEGKGKPQERIPMVSVDGVNGTIDIDHSIPGYLYSIPMDDCRTTTDILRWCDHIIRKSWSTKELIIEFIAVTTRHNKLKLWR